MTTATENAPQVASEKLIFEMGRPGRRGVMPPAQEVPDAGTGDLTAMGMLRKDVPGLPEASELDVIRHFTRLSQRNFSIDTNFYPLGSCTMKYNPKVNELVARLPGLAGLHPMAPEASVQGALQLIYDLEGYLRSATGMDRLSLQPAAGEHGEFTALLIIAAYYKKLGQRRTKVLVPDSAHGTNPSSAALAGFKVVSIKSGADGAVDLNELDKALGDDVACLMLTNPSTLGLFERDILEVAKRVHAAGALLYYDGANLNATLGLVRPGDMGFDLVHLNLHKTFSTPHGGGGPGAGPVGVKKHLVPYLPSPMVELRDGRYVLDDDRPESIGQVRSFWGNFLVLVRAYAFIRAHGAEGLKAIAQHAVLNANYLLSRLKGSYDVAFDRICMHEFVLTARGIKVTTGVRALDIAKRLLDYGIHAPTVYFPLIVEEAMMIEPTETESKETLDLFVDAMLEIAHDATERPDFLKAAPHTTPVSRLDEVGAARNLDLAWHPA
ncbi:MAG TPA: aminomethyl-transferring glycine dehydrogenase subunit GcvPB [Candidatus Xenobia bacterium]